MIIKIGKKIFELNETDEREKITWEEANQKAVEIGYKLPTRKELKEIHKSFHVKGLGGFKNEPYWTADRNGENNAWYVSFMNGNDNWTSKSSVFNVRFLKVIG